MVFASLFTVADGIFVGQGVGSNALAAINIVAPLFLITTGLALTFGVGVSVVASIHLAQGNNRAANINVSQAFDVGAMLMIIIAIAVYIFRIPFMRLLGSSDALLPLCQDYLLSILPGCIFIVIQLIGTFVIRLDGSPKFAALLEIVPGLLNIFLDWLFVFPMQMGVAGSGIASSVSCAVAAGWVENEEYVSKAYLDEICSDKPLLMQTGGGHSMLLNTKAMEWAGIDAAYAKKWGYDLVHVDKDGEPDGYICEGPVFEIAPKLPTTVEDIKEYLLAWQEMAFSSGFTAVGDAGAEVIHRVAPQAYYELEKEGKLKLRTHAWMYVADNADAKTEIARITAQRAEMSGEYFHIIGPKAFLDGVTEAHTGWQNQDYLDQPGYHGNERFNDHDKMVQLIVEADKEGMSVHVHSEGGGATHYMLGCIEDAEKITGNLDQRNVLAHLHFVTDEDCRRMGATGSVPAVPPLWTAKASPIIYEQEVAYMGQQLANEAYPIKSFYDAGANVVFHSDYPRFADDGYQAQHLCG